MAKKRTWKFCANDYLKDTELLPLEAQGFWMRLLCHMHASVRRGYLWQANGQPYSLEQIALATGCSTEKAAHLRQCLISSGVASVTDTGALFNRRMVREAEISEKRRIAGAKGNDVLRTQKQDFATQNERKRVRKRVRGYLNDIETEKLDSLPIEKPPGVGGCGGAEVFAIANESQNTISPAIDIAQRFSFVCAKRRGSGFPFYAADGSGCEAEAQELLRHVPYDAIVSEIECKERNKSEWFSDMANRLLRNLANGTWKGGKHGHKNWQGNNGRAYSYNAERDG